MTTKAKSLEKSSKPEAEVSYNDVKTHHGGISAPGVDVFPDFFNSAGNLAIQRLLDHGAVQTKLTIGQPNDKYEQEADRVAEQVMGMPETEVRQKST